MTTAADPAWDVTDDGAKTRDYWWTVLVVDPVAIPLTRLLAKRRLMTPDEITIVSLVLGLLTGLFFAVGDRWALVTGGLVYYASFVLDCVDGKLARTLNLSSARGHALDAMSDSARRASAAIGIVTYLVYSAEAVQLHEIVLAAAFGVLSAYFIEISGAERGEGHGGIRGRWAAALAKRRLLPTPGMPDVSALVYVIGPISGFVIPALYVGLAMVAAGIAITWRRRLRS
ncbi:MAG: CDP-alcohol phosphatidyltransferase family protein [Actinobacteria bacterium]|nr:CDP-alcohol phosphatidyltransferase family protein [Actinomycetota bacterium]